MQKYKPTIVFLVAAFAAVILITFVASRISPPAPIVEINPPTTTDGVYTLAEVAAHPNAASCWTAINGSVYDITPFINSHPGGVEAILNTCGIDATALFETQHGGQNKPEQELANLKIGTLK